MFCLFIYDEKCENFQQDEPKEVLFFNYVKNNDIANIIFTNHNCSEKFRPFLNNHTIVETTIFYRFSDNTEICLGKISFD